MIDDPAMKISLSRDHRYPPQGVASSPPEGSKITCVNIASLMAMKDCGKYGSGAAAGLATALRHILAVIPASAPKKFSPRICLRGYEVNMARHESDREDLSA
ncbi:MAG: hypothetical protein R3C99_09115 [Pirellulaceae bacterium]